MVRNLCLWSVTLVVASTAAWAADGPAYYAPRALMVAQPLTLNQIPPTPTPYDSGIPMPDPTLQGQPLPPGYSYPTIDQVPHAVGGVVPLYTNVKYRAVRNIHPCAIPMVVQVPDPCDPCCEACVNVKICVPPCDCPRIRCRRNGDRLIYDFGKYKVTITSAQARGIVLVDYHD